MKSLLITALLVSATFFAAQAQAGGGEILSAKQISATELELEIYSQFHCNDPIVVIDYDFSYRTIFGPHIYELNVVPTNKMHCIEKAAFSESVAIPANLRSGDVIVIRGENDTKASVTLE